MNNWKDIWSSKDVVDIDKQNSLEDLFLELKRIDGFDTTSKEIGYSAYLKQFNSIIKCMSFGVTKDKRISSLFEVGCGSGANLVLANRLLGYRVGGIDYSKTMIESANKVVKSDELVCDEAINMGTDIKYDVVLSNSVFAYFKDYEYAEKVLEKMLEKSKVSIGVVDVHDIEREEAFIAWRKASIPDYDTRYKDLHKLSYNKKFFLDFGWKHKLNVIFTPSGLDGYWNNDYVFNVFMTR